MKGTSQVWKVFCFALVFYIILGFYLLYSFSKSSLKTQAVEAWYTAGGGFTCAKIFSGTPMVVKIYNMEAKLFLFHRSSSSGGIGLGLAFLAAWEVLSDKEEEKR